MADAECITKACSKCGAEKPLTEYRLAKRGKMCRSAECKQCASAREKKSKGPYSTWSEERKAKHIKRKKDDRRSKGSKPRSECRGREQWEANAKQAFIYWIKERATDEQVAKWWAAIGKPWLNGRLSDAEQYRLKYAQDLEFQVRERMRRQINKAKKRDGIADLMRRAIYANGTSKKVERELGYSIADLMRHIEKQFTKRMTWDRFKAGEIHIDHIIPQTSFDLTDDDEWRRCWCLSNLRPMWAKENLAKRDRGLTLC